MRNPIEEAKTVWAYLTRKDVGVVRRYTDLFVIEPRLVAEARAISPEYFEALEKDRRVRERKWLYQVSYMVPTPDRKGYIGREVVAQVELLDTEPIDVLYSKWSEALASVPAKLKEIELEEFAA